MTKAQLEEALREANKMLTRKAIQYQELEVKLTESSNRNKAVRKEFAKAFNWKENSSFYRDEDYLTPTWEQIFVKVGKLLVNQELTDLQVDMKCMEGKLYNLEGRINDTSSRDN
jgi:hypothetical protein